MSDLIPAVFNLAGQCSYDGPTIKKTVRGRKGAFKTVLEGRKTLYEIGGGALH